MPTKATTKPVKKTANKASAKIAPKQIVNAKSPNSGNSSKAGKSAPAKKANKPAVSASAKANKTAKPNIKAIVSKKTSGAAKNTSRKTGPSKGRGRVTSPSGPLSSAVVSVLKRVRRPLSCAEITDALLKKNYQFTHPDPKRIVSIRIYKLKGVQQTGPGRFTAA